MSQRICFLNLAVLLSLDLYHVFLSEDCGSTDRDMLPRSRRPLLKLDC